MSGKKVEFLYLCEEDMIKAGVLDAGKCVDTIDEMFKIVGEGDYLMGGLSENEHGLRIIFPAEKRFPNMPVIGPDRRFMAMPAYLGGKFNVCCNKWYGSNIANPSRGLPRSVLTIVLNDVETGEPLAYMSANLVSAMRTGAIPAVGARYLCRKDAGVIAMIGGGVISKATLRCLASAMKNCQTVKIYDIDLKKGQQYAQELGQELGLNIIATNSIEEAVVGADFINVATSGAVKPVIKEEWLKDGAVLASSAWADISENLLINSNIVMDEFKMHKAIADEDAKVPENEAYRRYNLPSTAIFRLAEAGKIEESAIRSLSTIAAGKVPGRQSDKEIFILILGGMPVEDAAWSYTIYQNAMKMGIGQKLTLWNEPHWM